MRKTRSQSRKADTSVASDRSTDSGTPTPHQYAVGLSLNQSTHPLANSNNVGGSNSTTGAQKRPHGEPTTIKEHTDMVNTLRVVDLQKLLSLVGASESGRKADLQRRIIGLLRQNFELLAPKIRSVYLESIGCAADTNKAANMYSHMQMPQVQQNPSLGAGLVGGGVAPHMAGVGGPGNMVNFPTHLPSQIPIHPDVRLKKLAFYDVLSTLIKPSSLLPRSNQRQQEVPFYFTLTPQQATEIATNRDTRNSSKIEHAIQVQLRFCLLETSCEQEDCFPPNVNVKVNNKLCQLPNIIPTNRPNVEPKRPPRPVNVTSNVKLSPTVTNTITVQWTPDFVRGYCIAVYLVKKLTSAQLLTRLKNRGIKPADFTRALIKEKLREDADCEIATTMLKVSLNCPLGKMKMSIPCRASTCSHLQCFDANLFLQMNERKPTWNCPVCDKPALFDNLVIDGYFQEVLASALLTSDDAEIQLHKDGSWSTHALRNESQVVDNLNKTVEKVEIIQDDCEPIAEDVKPMKAAEPPAIMPNEQTASSSDTVDLTLSDSDDDMPLAKRRNQKQASAAAQSTTTAAVTSNGQQRGAGAANAASKQQPQRKNSNDSVIDLDSSGDEETSNQNNTVTASDAITSTSNETSATVGSNELKSLPNSTT